MHDEQGLARVCPRRLPPAALVERPVAAPACADLRRHVDALGGHLAAWRP